MQKKSKFLSKTASDWPFLIGSGMMSEDQNTQFVRLLAEHDPHIRGAIMVLVPDWHDAQDIMQKVCVVLWRKFSTYQPGTSFLAWATVIARLEVKDHWKHKKRERLRFSDEFIDLVSEETESLAVELEDRRGALKFCLDRLKSRDRELVRLRYYDGSPIEEIASEVGRSRDAVYKSLARLRVSLVNCVTRRTVGGGA